ncbi:hypothetical protein RB195_012658 [Necator americanus]|uniref:Uncharacterized protein n=1 Tax=Necator americanus TaxID=51031 RepID=A0ABR1DRZ8_NECAM
MAQLNRKGPPTAPCLAPITTSHGVVHPAGVRTAEVHDTCSIRNPPKGRKSSPKKKVKPIHDRRTYRLTDVGNRLKSQLQRFSIRTKLSKRQAINKVSPKKRWREKRRYKSGPRDKRN